VRVASAFFSMIVLALAGGCAQERPPLPPPTMAIPEPPKEAPERTKMATRKDDVTDDYFGVKVADPYRWLENGESEETRAFIDRENEKTREALDLIPGRNEIAARVRTLLELGVTTEPAIRLTDKGTRRYFHVKRTGTQNQPVLYVRDGVKGEDRVLLDPATLSQDGTTALDWWYPSKNGDLVAWGRSENGSEESTLYVRDVASGKDISDKLPQTRHCTVAWLPDGTGFYYTRFPEPGSVPAGDEKYGSKIFFHKLGDDPKKDGLVFGEGREKTDVPGVSITPDGRWLLATVHQGWDKSEIFVFDRHAKDAQWVKVAGGARFLYGAVPRDDGLYIHTNENAPRYELWRADYTKPAREAWKKVLPQGADVLEDVSISNKEIVATYLHDASSRVERFTREGKSLGAIELPAIGTASARVPPFGGEMFVSFTSFVVPTEVFHLDLEKPKAKLEIWERVGESFGSEDIEVSRMNATSKDGTRVPMFVIAKKGWKKDGKNPTVLYGYGGFNVNQTPGFSTRALTIVERGGVWVTAVLRGGGEFGEAWHQAGMLDKKQNVFDDFIAAAETLISEKVTSPDKLAIMGGSNGGLLVATAVTQRPELFRAGLSLVPLTDMLRYHHFRIAKLWIPEYGSSEDEKQFHTLYAYSPLHHVHDGTRYPAMLFTTAESDSRVDPLHARKMAARMQEAQGDRSRPILLRTETKAGHGAGKPVSKLTEELTDEISFVLYELGAQ
jgi:prolyl oligopeptidase